VKKSKKRKKELQAVTKKMEEKVVEIENLQKEIKLRQEKVGNSQSNSEASKTEIPQTKDQVDSLIKIKGRVFELEGQLDVMELEKAKLLSQMNESSEKEKQANEKKRRITTNINYIQ